MNKELKCKNCGETTTTGELLKDNNGDFTLCPTCENTKFLVIGGEEGEEIDTLNYEDEDIEVEDLEIEEPIECTCIHCGDDFISNEEDEVCEDCQDALDNSKNIDLHIALAEYFGCNVKDITYNNSYNEWNIDGTDYMVLTDYEADERCKDYITETLWAFNPSFLADETELPSEIFEALLDNGKCESNNDILEEVIEKTCGIDSFVESAIAADGRGHFLNHYNSEEDEIIAGSEYYYAYIV